jgi:hypothetical protein
MAIWIYKYCSAKEKFTGPPKNYELSVVGKGALASFSSVSNYTGL